jgi:DNA-binding protein Fis
MGGIEPGLTLRELERTLLEKTLDATGGNRTRAAGMLGVSLRTVRNKIREFGLPPRRAV